LENLQIITRLNSYESTDRTTGTNSTRKEEKTYTSFGQQIVIYEYHTRTPSDSDTGRKQIHNTPNISYSNKSLKQLNDPDLQNKIH
jgi:hypothetical protein